MQRRCVVCRQSAGRVEMLRLVRDADGQVWPDVLQKAPGRGAYVCWQDDCLARLQEKHLARAWKGAGAATGQVGLLRERTALALRQLCKQAFRRLRGSAAVGRDAVMHRMWDKAPLLVLLAGDAGGALKRQIEDACAKRQAAGDNTTLVIFGDSATLGDMVERDIVSVLALEDTPASAGFRQHCLRCARLGKA